MRTAGIATVCALGALLIAAFGASIGGIGTPIGTPPNVIGLGFMRDQLDKLLSRIQR